MQRWRAILTIGTLLLVISEQAFAQVYTEKKSRHRFAQLTLGLDYQSNFGGETAFFSPDGSVQARSLDAFHYPRILIGGTHFWGHADFYIGISLLAPNQEEGDLEVAFEQQVETAFKVYPWRIEYGKVRPFVGLSLAPFSLEQTNNAVPFGEGPNLTSVTVPLLAGFTYNRGNHLFELSAGFRYNNKVDYPITDLLTREVEAPPVYASFSYRYMLETTLSAEKGWESGRTKLVTERLAINGALNDFYVGIGMSSAWWLGRAEYNDTERPFMPTPGISVMPDVTVGYYRHKPDINVAMHYRGYASERTVYGVFQRVQRHSIGLEVTKNFADYHGFVPFIGPVVSFEHLRFREQVAADPETAVNGNELGYGLTFGWDIRPNRIQWFLLRTNLRYFPRIRLDLGEEVTYRFDAFEFNFIQFICFPDRLF